MVTSEVQHCPTRFCCWSPFYGSSYLSSAQFTTFIQQCLISFSLRILWDTWSQVGWNPLYFSHMPSQLFNCRHLTNWSNILLIVESTLTTPVDFSCPSYLWKTKIRNWFYRVFRFYGGFITYLLIHKLYSDREIRSDRYEMCCLFVFF